MEAQMGALSLEQQAELPSLILAAAKRIREIISATTAEKEIIRAGEFCLSPSFCNDLNLDSVSLILKTLKHEVKDMDQNSFRAEFFSRASEEALVRSINLGDSYALQRATAYGSLAVYYLPQYMPERGIVISAFGRTLRQRWNVSQDINHLSEAIYYFRKTVELEPPEEANRPLHFDDLGCALRNRYKQHHLSEDFEESMKSFNLAIGYHHPATPAFHSNLGQLLFERANFEHPRDAQAFDKSIDVFKAGLASITNQFRGPITWIYYRLGHASAAKYLASRSSEDWQNTIEAFDESISRVKPPNSNYLSVTHGIGNCYSETFGKVGNLEICKKAEDCYELAIQASPKNLTVMASMAENMRFKAYCIGSQALLNESIQLIDEVLEKTSTTDSDLPLRLGHQADALATRFMLLGHIPDIDQAISARWKALESPMLKDEARWRHWMSLSHALLERHEHLGEIEDLQNAALAVSSALECKNSTSNAKSDCMYVFGKVLFRTYMAERDLKNLEKSIETYQNIIKLPSTEIRTIFFSYNDLGNAFMEKFEVSKSNTDLQAAAAAYENALQKLHASRSALSRNDESMLLNGLGNVQFRQFQQWSRASDLDTAIAYYKKSADATPEWNIRIVTRTSTLCFALEMRYDITRKIEDLEDAQRRLEAVIALPLQLSAPAKSYVENRMGIVYLLFYFHSSDAKHLDSAIDHFNKALASGCKDPAHNMSASANLAKALAHKCDATKSDSDITTALVHFYSLLRSVKPSDPEMGSIVMNVADFFSSIYDLKQDVKIGQIALTAYLAAVNSGQISPRRRIDARMKAARLTFTIGKDTISAFDILKSAVQDLPEVILTGLNRSDQLRIIRDCTWLPSNVAAATIAAGHSAEEAVRLFEASRGIIWESLLNEKFDIGPLETQHPEIAQMFKSLHSKISQAAPANKLSDPDPVVLRKRQEYHQAALDYNNILTQIRSLPGFESFLRIPQGPSSLKQYAQNGPVVIINSNEFRSDAFLVKQDGVVSVPLPNMTSQTSLEQAANFMVALSEMSHSPDTATQKFEEVLKWLWTAVAKPVMEALGFLNPIHHKRPRIWWMATGWISMLPIHAAGDHRRALATGEACSVIDLVTSSYCSSLRSLQNVRDVCSTSHSIEQNSLLLKMPETPNHESLPGVTKEVSLVKDVLETANVSTKISNHPTRDATLASLKMYHIAHFACHGVVDAKDPSLSRLLLQDWKQRPFNVRTLLRTKDLACRLIYLSACESAVGKDRKLREEGIHIAAGFQMASVPHVIGTLWQVEDQLGAQIAEKFYQGLIEKNTAELSKSSESLRLSIMDARANGVDPLYWAAYIHYGP